MTLDWADYSDQSRAIHCSTYLRSRAKCDTDPISAVRMFSRLFVVRHPAGLPDLQS